MLGKIIALFAENYQKDYFKFPDRFGGDFSFIKLGEKKSTKLLWK